MVDHMNLWVPIKSFFGSPIGRLIFEGAILTLFEMYAVPFLGEYFPAFQNSSLVAGYVIGSVLVVIEVIIYQMRSLKQELHTMLQGSYISSIELGCLI